MSYLGWEQINNDFWIFINPDTCDLRLAASAIANYRITGQTRTIAPEITTHNWQTCLYVSVSQQVLPNGTEAEFWLDITMQDTSVVRVPTTGSITVRVYR